MSLLPLKSLKVQRPEFKSTVTGSPVTNKRDGAMRRLSFFTFEGSTGAVGEGSAKGCKIFGQF